MEDEVLKLRKSLDKINYFDSEAIQKFPAFFDFVSCNYFEDQNFQMLLGGMDDFVAARFFWNGCYEKKTLSLWSKFCRNINNKLIFDIGAHTGSYTLAAMSSNKSNTILSFEPHFVNFSRLNLNLRKNNFSTKNLYMCCVGDTKKVVPFSIMGNYDHLTSGGSVGERSSPLAITQHSQQVSMDQFIKNDIHQKIGLIKIDVEGYELNAFLGMSEILKIAKPTIFFEALADANKNEISKLLDSCGYIYYDIDDKNNTVKHNANLENGTDYFNHNRIAIHKDSLHISYLE